MVTGEGGDSAETDDGLMELARYGEHAGVVAALAAGADPAEADERGNTALHLAAANGHLTIVDALLGAGAKVSPSGQMLLRCFGGPAPRPALEQPRGRAADGGKRGGQHGVALGGGEQVPPSRLPPASLPPPSRLPPASLPPPKPLHQKLPPLPPPKPLHQKLPPLPPLQLPPLTSARRRRADAVVERLLRAPGADVLAPNAAGHTPLAIASALGRDPVVAHVPPPPPPSLLLPLPMSLLYTPLARPQLHPLRGWERGCAWGAGPRGGHGCGRAAKSEGAGVAARASPPRGLTAGARVADASARVGRGAG